VTAQQSTAQGNFLEKRIEIKQIASIFKNMVFKRIIFLLLLKNGVLPNKPIHKPSSNDSGTKDIHGISHR
jgi:hypothetical protein